MSPIEALALVIVGAASVSLAALVIIVTIGIRHEERALTLTRRMAPGLAAWLARQIVGLYVRKTDPEPVPGDDRAAEVSGAPVLTRGCAGISPVRGISAAPRTASGPSAGGTRL